MKTPLTQQELLTKLLAPAMHNHALLHVALENQAVLFERLGIDDMDKAIATFEQVQRQRFEQVVGRALGQGAAVDVMLRNLGIADIGLRPSAGHASREDDEEGL